MPIWIQNEGSLAFWAAIFMERIIWMRYYESNKIDPRKQNEGAWSFETLQMGNNYERRITLIEYWKTLNSEHKLNIIGDIEELIKNF